MKRTITCNALLIIGLCLVASAAMADQCKPINARVGESTYYTCPEAEEGETQYLWCIDAQVTGTINGTWHYYGDGGQVEAYPGDPYSSLWSGWALDVFETKGGMIYAQDTWLWNLDAAEAGYKAGLPMVTISNINGGTGPYEEASGWIGMILDDTGAWRGFMKGEICIP